MKHDDILHQIPDYVLGIIPPKQRRSVERHAAHCIECQRAIGRERQLSHLVRSTVDVATEVNAVQVRNMMPSVPRQRRSGLILNGWQRQFAPAILILLLLFGGLTLNKLLPAGSVPALIATAHAATATSTYTPTATVAQSMPENIGNNRMSKVNNAGAISRAIAVPSPHSDRPLETPDPIPTPVAAIRLVTAQ